MGAANQRETRVNECEFYDQVLGLTADWEVVDVALRLAEEEVHLVVQCRAGRLPCPTCGADCAFHDYAAVRTWRHLDTCQLRTYLQAEVPRVRCAQHGVLTAAVPWAMPYGRFTLLFETFALRLLRACMNQSKAAELLHVSFDELHEIMRRAVARGLARRDQTRLVTDLAIDEKSLKRGHHYVTVLSDREAGHILELSENRKTDSAVAVLDQALTAAQQQQVTSITMDMWEPYMKAAAARLPLARVVHDKFHIIKHLNDAVDRTRRHQNHTLAAAGKAALKHTKYLFLKSVDRLKPDEVGRLTRAMESGQAAAEAWLMKEVFHAFFQYDDVERAARYLRAWCTKAHASGIRALAQVANLLTAHAPGLLAYIRLPITNAIAETLNGKLQLLKATGRGYRRFANFRTVVLFHCGALDLFPLKSQ